MPIKFIFLFILLSFQYQHILAAENTEILNIDSGTQKATLIELYTSEGCSSCPPAEAWLNNLDTHPDLWKKIIPIAFHVNYWDYLGWKDRFATDSNTQRQYQHRKLGNTRSVYTPGFFVNGKEWRSWFRGGSLPDINQSTGIIKARLKHRQLTASYSDPNKPVELHVAILGFGLNSDVTRGENRSRTLEHEFVLLDHQSKVSSTNSWTIDYSKISISPAEKYALALWVQEPGKQTPLQATGSWLDKKLLF